MDPTDDSRRQTVGETFQELTKYRPGRMPAGRRLTEEPPPFKEYPDAEAVIPLASVRPDLSFDLWTALAHRRSRREYTGGAIPYASLEALAWAAQGVTARSFGYFLRTAPSAGALYPVETYVYAHAVDRLAQGLYHLNVPRWSLERLRGGDLGRELASAALDQGMVGRAAVTFAWTAVVPRCSWKYGQRAYRYIYLDAGHIAENVALAAEALGLGCCAIAALYDEEVNAILGVDGREETVLYLTTVGPVIK
jgi:SagB-type dehydrogenase family enzyme